MDLLDFSLADDASDEAGDDEDEDAEGDDEDEFEEVEVDVKYKKVKTLDWERVNANVAVWARDKDEVTDEEYQNFYKVRGGGFCIAIGMNYGKWGKR